MLQWLAQRRALHHLKKTSVFFGMSSVDELLPSMLPCSQSTRTQSTPDLASMRDTFAPGIICQAPNAFLPSRRAVRSLLDCCMADMFLVTPRSRSVLVTKAGRNRKVAKVHTLLISATMYIWACVRVIYNKRTKSICSEKQASRAQF